MSNPSVQPPMTVKQLMDTLSQVADTSTPVSMTYAVDEIINPLYNLVWAENNGSMIILHGSTP